VEDLASFLVCCADHPDVFGRGLSPGKLVMVPPGLAKSDLYQQLFGSLVVRNDKDVLGWVPIKSARDQLAKMEKWYISP
jgi:hypothetical protein